MNNLFGPLPRFVSTLPCLFLLVMVLSLARFALAAQDNQSLSCPAASEVQSELAIRKDKLVKLKSGLEQFMAGKATGDASLSALFMIDLTDANAISRRVEELRQEVSETTGGTRHQDPFIVCALTMEELRAAAEDVLALQKVIAGLRLQFLTLTPEKRSAILHPQMEASVQADTVKQLQEERSSALEEQKQAVKSLARAEQQALSSEVGITGNLAVEQAAIEKTKSELATLQVKWITDLEQQAAFYQETAKNIAEIGKILLMHEGDGELKANYEKTAAIWRSLVDKTPQINSDRFAVSLPPLPEYPEKLLGRIGDTADARQYADAYTETKVFRDGLQEKIRDRLQESIDLHYRVLLQSGEVRSQLLNLLLDKGDRSPLAISRDLFQDVRREFTIVPYRWAATFYLRSLDIRADLGKGLEGWMEIAANLGLLLAFLMIPFAIWKAAKHLTHYLIRLRAHLVRQSRTHPWASHMALVIQNMLPYTFWLVMLLAMFIAQKLLAVTVFRELSLLLPYIIYYIYYRLFRQLMQCDYVWVNQQIRAAKLWDLRREVDIAARTLGLSVLLIFSFLSAIESLIRRGLIYHLATSAMAYLGILIAMGFTYQWREVIAAGLAKLIPGALGLSLAKLCHSRYGLILCIPALVLLLLVLTIREITEWSNRFEFTRKIGAEIFRYQLGSAVDKGIAAEAVRASEEYRRGFPLTGITDPAGLHSPHTASYSAACKTLEEWTLDTAKSHSLAIIGNQGIGKSCLLQFLEQRFPAYRVIRISVPGKLTSREAVMDFLDDKLGFDLAETGKSMQESDNDRAKIVVLIDDAHNLFLSTLGGFEGFKAMLEWINQPTGNIFWCLAFNLHAWAYLNSVTSCQQYFGSIIRMAGWPENEIQALILTLHGKTGYKLSYDDIIHAVESQLEVRDVLYVENRFFRMLCQQSRGNPRLAIQLWLSAVRGASEKALRAGLPEQVDTAFFSKVPENALFVYACIARHGNLSFVHAAEVTQLPEGVIRQALESGLSMKLLEPFSNGAFRLAPLYQYPLINFLLAKHFLYE